MGWSCNGRGCKWSDSCRPSDRQDWAQPQRRCFLDYLLAVYTSFTSARSLRVVAIACIAGLSTERAHAQSDTALTLAVLPGEHWFGGRIGDAHAAPYTEGFAADLHDNAGNQVQPLLLSTAGRYVWSDGAYRFALAAGAGDAPATLVVTAADALVRHGTAPGGTLAAAHALAVDSFFRFDGRLPARELFAAPQYNTWIELIYDQNQADVMAYARGVVEHGFAPGVLMIDDNWQRDYGDWRFRADRFPDPRAMVDSLHAMGFRVMLWVCPFVSPDHENFRHVQEGWRGFLDDPADTMRAEIVRWWNGHSAVLDLADPRSETWLRAQLDWLREEYGVDGFKLDAGDFPFYESGLPVDYARGDVAESGTTPQEQSELFARIGLDYLFNEYRATWRLGGAPLAQRLGDKGFAWGDLRRLIPGMLTTGLMGYPYAAPDMIGGGEYRSFLALDSLDGELVVRSAQVHALMPMMQFSVAPWRVLDEEHLAAVRAAAALHVEHADRILALAERASRTGEPIVRPLAYAYPGQGYADVRDAFLLGEDLLVAPVLERGARARSVRLPRGERWRYVPTGEVYDGGDEVTVPAPLDVLPRFAREP